MRGLICLTLFLIIMSGCKQNIPKPETFNVEASESKKAAQSDKTKDASIRHIVHGKDIFIECFVPNISFSGANKAIERGKIVVYVDGQLKGEFHTAAFVMKNLSKGVHHVKIDVVKLNNKSHGLSKEFYVTIL
ncbi:hypothetical protein MXL46_16280 [Heyndrickxia sporothermodurans]|uniref:hypothetical protein n=1 Tax=Heyndrickxia sporothermodurans TaxID=46224 RepID=UPI002DB6D4D0|nr:hypothetical protein [Heyndrickxia sporothermodurans]MEB6550627.1 hypothetical protein [Heyndrickxia sporothermodurans]